MLPPFAALIAAVLSALAGCGAEPTVAELRGYEITVPAGWSSEREGNGPGLTLVLHSPEHAVVCRISVVEDGRRASDVDARAYVTMGTDAYGAGTALAPARIDTADGPLEGVVIRDARIPSSFGVRALAGDPELEIVAAPRGHALVAAVVGGYPRDVASAPLRALCLRAVASMRVAR